MWVPLTDADEFRRVLSFPPLARSAHFSLHGCWMLSPASHRPLTNPVDNSVDNPVHELSTASLSAALGWVVPKRHARRAVTRNLIRRQLRILVGSWIDQSLRERSGAGPSQPGSAVSDRMQGIPRAVCVVRLRQPWDRAAFPSASSGALKHAVRDELTDLLRKSRLHKFAPAVPAQAPAA